MRLSVVVVALGTFPMYSYDSQCLVQMSAEALRQYAN